jgi:hypothetical protein
MNAICRPANASAATLRRHRLVVRTRAPKQKGEPSRAPLFASSLPDRYEQPEVVPQLTHLWQLPLGIMIDPHSGQVGASVRAMKL